MTRTSVLWVTEEVPDRSEGGGSIRQANLLRLLADRFDIDLLVAGPVVDPEVRASVRSVVEVVPVPAPLPGRLRTAWGQLVRRRPLAVTASAPAAHALAGELAARASGVDLVVLHHENLLPLLATDLPCPVALHVFDVKSERAAQSAAVSSGRTRWFWRLEGGASERSAARFLGQVDAIVACTEEDLGALLELSRRAGGRVPTGIVAPNGVDLERFVPTPPPGERRVLFFGSLDYDPNIDAARWLAQEVWPAVRAGVPDAQLVIAGRRPPAVVRDLATEASVEVRADVPDAAACYASADVAVVPLRVGTGSRLKVVEAMASGRPVAGTAIGLEGLGIESATRAPALVADGADALAAAVIRLLTDAALASEVAVAGRAHVARDLGWDTIAARLADALDEVVRPVPATTGATTVLVCTRGRAELLDDCVRSIAAALGTDDELLVVEAEGDAAASALVDIGVAARHLVAPRPGKSRQLNLGVQVARTEVVVLTDDDCRVDPRWVTAMAAPFADPSVGVVFGDVEGLSKVRGLVVAPLAPGSPPAVTWEYANGAAMAVRRSAVLAIGGYDERLGPGAPLHGEEHDLVLRLQEGGWTVRIADAPPVHHLEWRDDGETLENLLTYSRGAGAFLGVALRRAPRRWARLTVRRARYQGHLWRHRGTERWWFGPATSLAFGRGLVRGLLLRPRRFL